MKKKPYSELNGLIVAKGETCSSMATQIGISPQAMRAKMTGKSTFTATEIAAIGHILQLSQDDYYRLFILPVFKKGSYVA